jgi:hypothetical protein
MGRNHEEEERKENRGWGTCLEYERGLEGALEELKGRKVRGVNCIKESG